MFCFVPRTALTALLSTQGRMVFGNHLVERSLIVYCSSAEAHYHTTEVCVYYEHVAGPRLSASLPLPT